MKILYINDLEGFLKINTFDKVEEIPNGIKFGSTTDANLALYAWGCKWKDYKSCLTCSCSDDIPNGYFGQVQMFSKLIGKTNGAYFEFDAGEVRP